MTSRLFPKQNSCSFLLVRFVKWHLIEIIQKPEGIILMILVILCLCVALFIKVKPHQQQSSPSKRVFFSAAPFPVSRVQCSPEKMKTMKKIAPVLEPRSQGRREPWERRCLWDQHHQWGRQNACVWHTWQGLGVLSWSSLNISVFWSFTKNLLKARWSLAESFLNKVIVTLVTQGPLPSFCVSWLFSTIDYRFISMYTVFYCACSTETCEKVYLCQGSHWAKSSVVFWRLTQNTGLALLTEMPTHVMPTMNAEHARFPVLHWPGPQNAGAKSVVAVAHSAHISRRT